MPTLITDNFQPLPTYRDGQILTASSLNRIGLAQMYLNNATPFNYANWEFDEDEERYMIHRDRYLHWRTQNAVTADILINDVVADSVSSSYGGYIDLDSQGFDTHEVYLVKFDTSGGACRGMYLFEHYHTNTAIQLPYTTPTFSGGSILTAANLNAVSANTEHIVDNATKFNNAGFAIKSTGDDDIYFWLCHINRYLYVAAKVGTNQTNADFRIYINGGTASYSDVWNDPGETYGIAIDLSVGGSDHNVYYGDVHTITVSNPPALYDWYEVHLYNELGWCEVQLIGEMPERYAI